MTTDVDTILKVITLFGGAGGVGTVLFKKWKPRSMATADELQRVREDRAEDMADMRTRIEACEIKVERAEEGRRRADARAARADARTRFYLDYSELLRLHISDGKAPPPPPWPKEPTFDVE